jgi:hypothetical protein
MDYEQRYKDALDRAKKLKENSDSTAVIDGCEQIFPELKESDDERTRKELIDFIKSHLAEFPQCEKYIAWIEKQGETTIWDKKDEQVLNAAILHIKNKTYNYCRGYTSEYVIQWLESLKNRYIWTPIEKQRETNIQNNKPFKIESDKFYFCIKDYFAGGCYRSKKGDVVLAKNGMNMMGLSPKEASEYFIPINPFKEHVVVDWFEKQREETVDNANKIRPKFKFGDWVVFNGLTLYINEVVKGYYRTISKGGTPNSYDWNIDNAARLWTIKEARDGDVLVCESGWTCIFKTLVNEETFGSYCFMDSTEWFCGLGSECHTLKEEFVKAYHGKIQPATKEQRDLFFKKMQEAGYEWNAEKKVLKNLKPKFNVGDWIVSANGKVNQVISVNADNVDFEGYVTVNEKFSKN